MIKTMFAVAILVSSTASAYLTGDLNCQNSDSEFEMSFETNRKYGWSGKTKTSQGHVPFAGEWMIFDTIEFGYTNTITTYKTLNGDTFKVAEQTLCGRAGCQEGLERFSATYSDSANNELFYECQKISP